MSSEGKKVAIISIGVGTIALAVGLVTYFVLKKGKDTPEPVPPTPKVTCEQKLIGNVAFFIQSAANGQQLSSGPEGNVGFTSNKLSWERWAFEPSDRVSGGVQIKNLQQNLYLQALDDGTVDASTVDPRTWEGFKVEYLDDTCYKVALKGYHGKYLGLDSEKTRLVNTATSVGANETFALLAA